MSRNQPCKPQDCQDFQEAKSKKETKYNNDNCYDPVCASAYGKRVNTIKGLYQDVQDIEYNANNPNKKRLSYKKTELPAPAEREQNACPDPECGNAHAKKFQELEMLNKEIVDIEKSTKKRPISTKDLYDELQNIQLKSGKDPDPDACRDPICSNEHEKKIVDLSQGVSALEDILKNMTGLCRQPNCPDVEKANKPKLKSFTESMPPLPVPNRYNISDTDFRNKMEGDRKDNNKTLREILDLKDLKTCKGAKCYSAYMGYTSYAEPTKENLCSNPSCIPFPKSKPEKTMCGAPVCPFNKPKSPLDFGTKYDLGLGDASKPYDLSKFDNLGTKPCTFDTCTLKSTNYTGPQIAGKSPCGRGECPYKFDLTSTQPADLGGPPKVGLCGRTSCPYPSVTPNVRPVNQGASPCGQSSCPFKDTSFEPVGLCGQPNCPFMSSTSPGAVKPCPYAGQIKRYPCGSPSCPYVNPSGMLRTHEYTNDKSFVQEAARPYAGSASPFDYLSSLTTSYPSPYATNYPLFSYTDPPDTKPCPYLPKKEKHSCQNPKCPYAQKSRPETDNFCVSQTCPYEPGICGGQRKYCCESPEVDPCESPECPVCGAKPKKKKKDPCGNESCPYSEGICGGPKKYSCDNPDVEPCETEECPIHQQNKNTCPKTCPFSIGVCGGPKIYSCDSPDVLPCESPDCPMHKKKKKKKKRCKCCGRRKTVVCEEEETVEDEDKYKSDCPKTCPFSEGVCGGPKIYSCDSPDVIPCETPECPVTKKKNKCKCGKREKSANACSCSDPDASDDDVCGCGKRKKEKKLRTCPYSTTTSNDGGDSKCGSKTCPFLKKLVFCEDCGGVLPDELNSSSSSGSTESGTTESSTGDGKDQGDKPGRESLTKKDEKRGSNESAKNKALALMKNDGDKVPKGEHVSLYSYPGVQIGHKDCSYKRKLIPKNMGWLWNCIPCFGKPEFWRGYKPGAILKSVYKIMKKHRKHFDPLLLKKKKSKRVIENRHCIEVKKKEGEFHITVNPIKDPKTRNPMQSPYMDVTPLQFTVAKPQPVSDAFCPCDVLEEENLSCPNSDFDFHFSPPAAIQDPIPKKKKIKAETGAQYDIMDLPASLRKKGGGSKKGGKGKKGKKK